MTTYEAIEQIEKDLTYLCTNDDIVYGYTLKLLFEKQINQYQLKEIRYIIGCRVADGKYSI